MNFDLPQNAAAFVPHRKPMLLIDEITECSATSGAANATLTADNLFLDAQGALQASALLEMMAQTYAAVRGYFDTLQGKSVSAGYLVGMRQANIYTLPVVGDTLRIAVDITGAFDGFIVATGTVSHLETIYASGTLKLWIPR